MAFGVVFFWGGWGGGGGLIFRGYGEEFNYGAVGLTQANIAVFPSGLKKKKKKKKKKKFNRS